MRPWLALLAALVLTACDSTGPRPATLDSQSPPGLSPRFLAPEGWAWAAIQAPEGPELRYGVSAPAGQGRRAHVLILPDSSEPAEAWFETISALSGAGYVVWTLEWEAFGGSGRRVGPHDMAHAESPSAGARAIVALTTQVIRPETDRPLILLGSGDSAATVVMALQAGAPASAAILSAPAWGEGRPPRSWESLALRLRLGRLPSPEWRPWSREEAEQDVEDTSDPWRGRAPHQWRLANPDLRQSGVSLGWRAMQGQARRTILEGPGRSTRMLILTSPADQTASVLCRGLWACELVTEPATAAAPHLAADPARRPWVEQVMAFVARQTTP